MANIARLAAMACLMLAAGATRAVSQPDTTSANYIIPACEAFMADFRSHSGGDDVQRGACAGRVSGVWVTATSFNRVCSPPGVTLGQAIRVVIQFIDARPARMHEEFNKLALEALTAAWPCK
jgi:hypothetical protein